MTLKTKAFGDIITFTRASTGTYFDANGVLQVAAGNQPRFDHDPVTGAPLGLLIEEQRTNLLLRSSEFDNAVWGKSGTTVTPNAVEAPDGALTADRLVENTSNSEHFAEQISTPSANNWTSSVFVNLEGSTKTFTLLIVHIGETSPTSQIQFSGVSGVITPQSTSSGRITNAFAVSVGGGWYRCGLNYSLTAAASTNSLRVYTKVRATYTGDGTSGIYIWGAQLEAGSFPTSYIPTEASQVTRAADVCSVNTLSPWYNASEGTLVVKSRVSAVSSLANASAAFTDGTTFNRMILGQYFTVTRILGVGVSNIDQATLSVPAVQTGIPHTFAGAYKLNDFRGVVDGGGVLTDNSGNVPTVNRLNVGALNGTIQNLNGHIDSIRYYPRALSNTELQELTA